MCGEFHCSPVYFHIKRVTEEIVRGGGGVRQLAVKNTGFIAELQRRS